MTYDGELGRYYSLDINWSCVGVNWAVCEGGRF